MITHISNSIKGNSQMSDRNPNKKRNLTLADANKPA